MSTPASAAPDPALEHAWTSLVARAAARLRSEHARAGFLLGALAAVPLSALAAAFSLFDHPLPARATLAAALALPLLAALAGRLRPIPVERLHARIDRQFGLADEALAARELSGRASPAWRAAVLRQALAHTDAADWSAAWPVRWPRFTGPAVAAACLASLLALFLLSASAPAGPDPAAARRAEQQAALAELARQWEEKAGEDIQGEEWNAFRDSLAELQQKLAAPELTERELLVALARVESRLAEAQAALAEAGVSANAEELADALAGLENLAEASRSLREKDFAKAASALDQAAAKLAAEGAQVSFRDATGAETARRLDKLAQKAAEKRDAKLADLAKGLREAATKRDAKSLGQCSAALADQSREAAACKSARASLSSVARSLAQARLALAEGRSPSDDAARFAFESRSPARDASSGSQPGDGIGSGVGDHSLGEENALADAARQESVSGVANADGESTRRTVRASEAAPALASAGSEAELAEFARLSREAVADESLPLEHRRAIHRYFQLIRPASEPASPSPVSTSP